MNKKCQNLALSNSASGNVYADLYFHDLCNELQKSLHFDEIVALFAGKLQNLIAHSGHSYRNEDLDLEFKKGLMTEHHCRTVLQLENRNLGELTIMRSRRFTEKETVLFKEMARSLLYPLRNAVLYHQASQLAFSDPLTATGNRIAFNRCLEREMSLAARHSTQLSVIFLDIDHFKTINDNYGHECGDMTLISFAQWIKDCIRSDDILFRYGGEEFVILLSETDLYGAQLLAARILRHINEQSFIYGSINISITASLGISAYRTDETKNSFLKRADDAMYLAKKDGRNQIRVAP
ncbi:MAG: GGDEF domain-containing protein [Gammaproteobacteria bacterium]